MSTEELIKTLRQLMPLGPTLSELIHKAADRLEELQEQNALLSAAVCSGNPIQTERAVQERDEASTEVERLKTKLAQAISERTPHDYGILRDERDDYRDRLCLTIKEAEKTRTERDEARAEVAQLKDTVAAYEKAVVKESLTTRPEPSRLEIAAMLVAGRFSSTTYVTEVKGTWINYALRGADALIAAAREAK